MWWRPARTGWSRSTTGSRSPRAASTPSRATRRWSRPTSGTTPKRSRTPDERAAAAGAGPSAARTRSAAAVPRRQGPASRSQRSAREGGREMTAPTALLRLDNVTTYYGQMRILEGISLQVREGELVCLLGGNASGKSTTLKTILGIVRPRTGRVLLRGDDVTEWPVPQRISAGIAIVPENRRLFGQMTVRENLELGAVLRGREKLDDDCDRFH